MRLVAAVLVLSLTASGCLSGILDDKASPYDYIRDDTYTTWVIEIDSVQGQVPAASVLNTLKSRLDEVVRKDTITTQLDDTIPGKSVWSRGDLDRLHDMNQDRKTSGTTAVTHLVFLDGRYSDEGVLGVAIGHDFIAIFMERINQACADNFLSLPGACTQADRDRGHTAVLVHEFGHILGLVNNGIPMVNDHEASSCQGNSDSGHSSNQNSVMYCGVNTSGLFGLTTIPTTFDSNDKLDLCRAGGKGSC